jgi:hypothetical protein
MEISQVYGLQDSLDKIWSVKLTLNRYSTTAHKSRFSVTKADGELYVKNPLTNKFDRVTLLDNGIWISQECNTRDVTNSFIVLVTYNVIDKVFKLYQGTAGSDDPPLYDSTKEVEVGSDIEPNQGGTETTPAPVTNVRKNMQATGTLTIDWNYKQLNVTLTGNITAFTHVGTAKDPIELNIKGNYTITFPDTAAGWKKSSNSMDYAGTLRNKIIVSAVNDAMTEFDYTIDNYPI